MILQIGDQAPDFSLPSTEGQEISLSSLKGKKIALYFYPKDKTSGCTLEADSFEELKKEFDACDTIIVGMSPDSLKSHIAFKTAQNLSFHLVSDETKETLQQYGVWVQKSMYGRQYMGVERSTFLIGRDGKILQIWRKVKVKGHAEEVLRRAQQEP